MACWSIRVALSPVFLTTFAAQPAPRPPLTKPTAQSRGEDHEYQDDAQDRREQQHSDPGKCVVHGFSMPGPLPRFARPFIPWPHVLSTPNIALKCSFGRGRTRRVAQE